MVILIQKSGQDVSKLQVSQITLTVAKNMLDKKMFFDLFCKHLRLSLQIEQDQFRKGIREIQFSLEMKMNSKIIPLRAKQVGR